MMCEIVTWFDRYFRCYRVFKQFEIINSLQMSPNDSYCLSIADFTKPNVQSFALEFLLTDTTS